MSTKKLSRTVIEGGRAKHNKWERRHSHTEVRAEERDYLKKVMADLDLAEEEEIDLPRPVSKDFIDKLSPMYRWLDAQIGRPWDQVRSEIFQKFDTRTTAGRHITFDHLLRQVVDTESGFDRNGYMSNPDVELLNSRKKYWSFSDYYVDTDGILRKPDIETRIWLRSRYVQISQQDYQQAGTWLANRMVMEKAGQYYWLSPTQDIWLASWLDPYSSNFDRFDKHNLAYYVWQDREYQTRSVSYPVDRYQPSYLITKTFGPHWEKVEHPYSFRQRGQLSGEDRKFFLSLKDKLRRQILEFSQGR